MTVKLMIERVVQTGGDVRPRHASPHVQDEMDIQHK